MFEIVFLLEKDIFVNDDKTLKESLNKFGIKYKEFRYDEYGKLEMFVESSDPNIYFIPHGSVQFIRSIQTYYQNRIISCFNHFNCNKYFNKFYDHMMINNGYFLPFGSLWQMKDFIFSGREKIFIRPNSSQKLFSGTITSKEEFSTFIGETKNCYDIPEEEMVFISYAQNIISECRCIVGAKLQNIDISVLCGAEYSMIRNGTEKAIEYANMVLKSVDYKPSPFYSMDIALLSNGEYKVIEINPFCSCDWYECPTDIIVENIVSYITEIYTKGK